METWLTILGWTLSIVAAAGNGSIIFLVCSKRRLLTKTNAFIISLAVADLGVGASVFPSQFFYEIVKTSHNWSSTLNIYRIRWLFGYASVTSLCSLVLDRYVAIVKPLKYLNFMSRGRVFQIILVSWAIPVGFVITSFFLIKRNFVIIFAMFWEIFPCFFLIFCFSSMVSVVYKHDRSSATLAKQLWFNHRDLTVRSQDRSALTMMAIVIVVFLVCYGMYLRCSLVLLLDLKCNDTVYKIPMLVLNSAINPWVYAFFKRVLKKEMIKKLSCRKTKKKLQNQ